MKRETEERKHINYVKSSMDRMQRSESTCVLFPLFMTFVLFEYVFVWTMPEWFGMRRAVWVASTD